MCVRERGRAQITLGMMLLFPGVIGRSVALATFRFMYHVGLSWACSWGQLELLHVVANLDVSALAAHALH